MYWTRSDSLLVVLPAVGWFVACAIGGWLIVSQAFRLERRERSLAGTVAGLGIWLFCQNLLGRWLPPATSFGLSALLVLLIGLSSVFKARGNSGARGCMEGLGCLAALGNCRGRGDRCRT